MLTTVLEHYFIEFVFYQKSLTTVEEKNLTKLLKNP